MGVGAHDGPAATSRTVGTLNGPVMKRGRSIGLLMALTAMLGAKEIGGKVLPQNRQKPGVNVPKAAGHYHGGRMGAYLPLNQKNWKIEVQRLKNRRAMRKASQRRNRA